MPRFFIKSPPDPDGIICIDGDDARHIALSLRCAVGEKITALFDGVVYDCELETIKPDRVTARVCGSAQDTAEMACRVTLFVANPKAGKLDLIVQKATELGVAKIVPFQSERCVSRPDPGSAEKRRRRLEKIALEAAKQCGRGVVPEIGDTVDFRCAVKMAAESDIGIIAYEKENAKTLRDVIAGKLGGGVTVAVMTGSEGGFSPAEAEAAASAGVVPCGLGGRILRCETAPLYVLAAISYESEL